MNRMPAAVATTVFVAAVAFCDSSDVAQLRRFLAVAPAARLAAALAEKDGRCLGVMGYAIETPGVSRTIAAERGVSIIPGTSDMLMSEDHADLNRRARHYADKYNTLLLEHTTPGAPYNSRLQRPAGRDDVDAPEAGHGTNNQAGGR